MTTSLNKATPRPWRVEEAFDDCLSIVVGKETYDWRFIADVYTDIEKGVSPKPIGKAQMKANADLIVLATNTFSERESLLREAADFIEDTPLESPSGATSKIQAELVARIRTALGESGEKE